MRDTAERITIRGWLVAQSPLHIGGLSRDADVDLTLARDGLGRYVIPGSSLAGALRARMVPSSDSGSDTKDLAEKLWGTQDRASQISLEDALIFPTLSVALAAEGADGRLASLFAEPHVARPGSETRVEVRTGVGISRETGAAAPRILYTRAILGAGVAVRFSLTMDAPGDMQAEHCRAHLACLCELLSSKQGIRVGAVRTSGFGRLQLHRESARVEVADLRSRRGVLSRLGGFSAQPLEQVDWQTGGLKFTRPEPMTIEIPWAPLLPIMVKDSVEGLAVDMLPLTTQRASNGTLVRNLVLPGRSIRGAFRSHAERIMRTKLRADDVAESQDDRTHFLRSLDQIHLITALFGRAASDDKDQARDHHGLGALTIADVHGVGQVPDKLWHDLLEGEADESEPEADRGLSQKLRKELHTAGLYPRTRNAIDRWTGGTADGALFSLLEPRDVRWGPIRLEIDSSRLNNHELGAALALLFYVIRDFCAGMIPLGFGTTQGMGSAAAKESEIVVQRAPELTVHADSDRFDVLRSSAWGAAASAAFNAWKEPQPKVEAAR